MQKDERLLEGMGEMVHDGGKNSATGSAQTTGLLFAAVYRKFILWWRSLSTECLAANLKNLGAGQAGRVAANAILRASA